MDPNTLGRRYQALQQYRGWSTEDAQRVRLLGPLVRVAVGCQPAAGGVMNQSLRIIVADDEPDMREYFQKSLARLGHKVVAACENGRDLVEKCRLHKPDLVITDIKMPELDGIDAAGVIYKDRPVPVILVSAYHDSQLLARAEADHVLGYLVKPIKQADLEPVIMLSLRRFEQFEALRREAADLRQALEDRKVIERAKGLLMKKSGLEEQEAFRRLQKLASEKSRKLVEIAQMILLAEEALQPPG
jgi:response regulator NasT